MLTIRDILDKFSATAFTQKEKGTQFERLMKAWLKTDPRYANLFSNVWLWEEFPGRHDFGGKDTGIDLVAKTELGDYWAIQCKCYGSKAVIDKPAVDSFLATSSRTFTDETTFLSAAFAQRLWISTTNHWGANAEEAIHNQNPPVTRISLSDLEISPVDWGKLLDGIEGKNALTPGKQPKDHQLQAIAKAEEHFSRNDRGKLIMACGTGKTFTSLRLIERLVPQKGLVLFMVPSIALLNQALNDWMADAARPVKAVCICSDSKASRKTQRSTAAADDTEESIVDLALPACTNVKSILRQLQSYRDYEGLVVVFSTYQSIDVVSEAQKELLRATGNAYGTFDFIVCDEAHRTTGVKLSSKDESNFTKIHDNAAVAGKKRLYMTATPRLYGESAKIKASKNDCVLCSMDDTEIYGQEFFRVNFSYAVDHGILTDYKVLVLTVSENMIPPHIMAEIRNNNAKELNYDDTGRLIGVINGLSKKILGDKGITWAADPRIMKRALAFTHKIGSVQEPGTSRNVAHILPRLSELYAQGLSEEEQSQVVHIQCKHVDGGMSAAERTDALAWLAAEADDAQECRVITNVRCLSEGVDVPALDAVLFLSSRNSQVDVVQSVGRVMRSFRKGCPDEKKYGYIIIPVVVPENTKPEEALNDNNTFSVVWEILNALRSHDDHFNAHVNTIALNRDKGSKVTVGLPGFGQSGLGQEGGGDSNDGKDAAQISNGEVAKQLQLQFGDLQQGIFAKLVEKCGDRLYWENWAAEVGAIAHKYIERISRLVNGEDSKMREAFRKFVETLRQNLNPGITPDQCIEMLAQHLITRPVFEALFAEYGFIKNNSISSSMQSMVELLESKAVDKDLDMLQSFYDSVRVNVGKIDNLEGKQTIIKNLYEKFFKRAFPLTVEKLGTVYTPVECVDFIIRSVDDVLKAEFGTALTNENVHILDPFTGTGTFVTRLLQTGVIAPQDMVRKYTREIHCNEIVLLAYYIADVNIESVFQEQCPQPEYLPYNGICLTDTFQLGEQSDGDIFKDFFKENSEAVEEQRRTPVRVIIGNPPYSIGQKSANDNAQNQRYPKLEKRLADTYVASSNAALSKGLYDSYIKAFRWATDRIDSNEGGVIAFISNGAWIDGNTHDGFRHSLAQEFDKIFVFNLRGNQRTSGELSRREGGKIFGGGSRTPIAITILVKYPKARATGHCEIHYHDIGDYLDRNAKLKIIKVFRSYKNIPWALIQPNEKNDWINQRDGVFDTLLPLAPDKKFDLKAQSAFLTYAIGVNTGRDAWVSGFSKAVVAQNMRDMIDVYNAQIGRDIVEENPQRISWTRALRRDLDKGTEHKFNEEAFVPTSYRPFQKMHLYYDRPFIESPGIFDNFFKNNINNPIICFSTAKTPTVLITEDYPNLHYLGDTQCFPLYWYEENKHANKRTLFDEENKGRWTRRDGITDWFLKEVRRRFSGAKNLTKEDIFYYIYGLLHSEDYRNRFADDLRKSLPRIPIAEQVADFMTFCNAGRELAELHLKYETYPAPEGVTVTSAQPLSGTDEDYAYYAVEKMRYPKKGERGTIVYNSRITIDNIPADAYGYIVNGKPAIEWIMERYAVSVDKRSGIKNDPNLWAREHRQPRYVLDLLLSIIHVSLETQRIVSQLPKIEF